MWGIPAKHVLDAGRLRAREGMAEVDTRQRGPRCKAKRGPRCKAKNGVGTARLPPHSPSMLSVLESLNSGPSTLHASQLCLPSPPACQPCLSPSFAPPISGQRPLVKLASSAIPRVRPLASLHPSNLLPSIPDPSLARTLIPRSSSCPLISHPSTPRLSAAPVIHRNGTRTL